MRGIASKDTYGQRVRMMPNGDMYLGGTSNADAMDASYVGDYDFFITKYLAGSTTPSWTKMFGTVGYDKLVDFKLDSAGNVHAVGLCSGTVNSVATQGSGDACVFKLSSSGTVLCSSQYGGTGVDQFNAVAVDETNGFFYAVGNTTSPSFDATSRVGMVSGTWVKLLSSDCTKQGMYIQSPTTAGSGAAGAIANQFVSFGGVGVFSVC